MLTVRQLEHVTSFSMLTLFAATSQNKTNYQLPSEIRIPLVHY